MKKTYKIKKKKVIPVYYYVIVLIIILVVTGTAYSLWSTKLYVVGNVQADYIEQKLENIDFVTQSNDELITVKDSFWINAFTLESTNAINSDTVGVEANITIASITRTSRTATITMQFTNNNSETLTDGKIEISENTNNLTVNSSTVTSSVESSGTSTVTTVIAITKDTSTSTIKYRITYKVNGIKKCAYLIINFEK